MVELTHEAIDHGRILEQARRDDCGAVVLFLGTVRELTEGKQTLGLEYDAHLSMALRKLQEIEEETRGRWPVGEFVIAHRLGRLELGEVSVAVAVSCPHRGDAFEACRYAMDRTKQIVPIWKKEHWADGTTEWVHPDPKELPRT